MVELNLSELMDYNDMKIDDLDLYKDIIEYVKYGSMKHIYLIQFNTSDGYYSHSWIERTAFTTIEKAVDYIKREYGNAEDRTSVFSDSVKEFDLIPDREYCGDAEWLEIWKVEVE